MANQITDNRTLVHAADVVTPYDDLSGSAAGTLDTEIKIQNTGSIGQYLASSLSGLLYDAGSAQDWSSNVFYIWINCGIVGLLDTKTNGGFRIRFCGATVTDWFEVYVAGSDEWPASIEGGWTQFVVDIETARSTAVTNGWTNGTTPATTAIRYVGWAGITGGTMPRMVDNTWMDEIRRLPDGSPGIIVEGRNGGTTDWDSADIASQLGTAVGTFVQTAGGAYKINTPIQFGINDTTTHGFTDTNATWLWDDQEFLPDDVYALSALGNSGGTTRVNFGIKSGTGDDATGAQGLVIQAASTGARWDMDFNDPDLDDIGFWGCSFSHAGNLDLDDVAVSSVSTLYLDCQVANVSNSEQLRCSVVNAATADGSAFMVTDDMADIVFCSFEFSDGHAIELNAATPTAQTNKGNLFSGYTNTVDSTDAAILNSAAGALTVSSTNSSNLQTSSYRNTGGGSVSIQNSISITLSGLVNDTEVTVYDAGDSSEIATVENVTGNSFQFTDDAANVIDIYIHKADYYRADILNFTVPTGDVTIPISQRFDPNYVNN